MQALLLKAPNDFAIVERSNPRQRDGYAVVRIHRAGICATDVTTIRGQNSAAVFPMTPGHEFVGTISAVGAHSSFTVGDWVSVYPTQGCGNCGACRANVPNHCAEFRVWGVHKDGGCFAEFMEVPISHLIPVPSELRNETGALIEPAAVAAHAMRRSQLQPGQRVAVIGAGVIGLLVAQAARAGGAAQVSLVDRMAARRKLAAAIRFTDFVLSNEGDLGARLKAAGGPFDIVFDNVGVPETIAAAVEASMIGGLVVLLAFPHGEEVISLPYLQIYRKELSFILSRNCAREDFEEAIRLLRTGAIAARNMISATYALGDFARALDALRGERARKTCQGTHRTKRISQAAAGCCSVGSS